MTVRLEYTDQIDIDCILMSATQLLNTVSNLGGTWPRYFVLRGVDYYTIATCSIANASGDGSEILMKSQECVSDHGKAACAELGGICRTERDGYYITSSICIALGMAMLIMFVQPTARKLQGELPGRVSCPEYRLTCGISPSAFRMAC